MGEAPPVVGPPSVGGWLEGLDVQAVLTQSGIGIFRSTPEGRYLYANQALATMLGYPDAAALLADTADIAAERYGDSNGRRRFLEALGPGPGPVTILSRARRRDGSVFWCRETALSIRRADGTLDSYLGVIVDVSDLIAAQVERDEAQALYRGIFENATIGIYRSSPEGRMVRSNPALYRMNGYACEADHIAAVNDIATEWYVEPGRRDAFKRLLECEGRVEDFVSEVYRHKTRERIWIEENAWPVRDGEGRIVFYEGTVQDITERRQQEAQLVAAKQAAEAADAAKSAFLANMSHELRTPLNGIIGFAELIRSEMFGPLPQRYKDFAENIHDSGQMLAALINDVLDMAKINAGGMTLHEHLVEPARLIAREITNVRMRADAGGVALHSELPPALPRLQVDELRMRQVLMNLLSNAVKFTLAGGSVTVGAGVLPDGRFAITVSDTGIGMTEEEVRLARKPFRQVDSGIARRFEGTGLGLPIADRLVGLHGGSLEIDSEPGRGTTCTILLPAERVRPGP
ncbi:MAG: hypothetical protein OHK0024_18950 [Thalassobaculales bacterium]